MVDQLKRLLDWEPMDCNDLQAMARERRKFLRKLDRFEKVSRKSRIMVGDRL